MFKYNAIAKKAKTKNKRGPLTNEEILNANYHWVCRAQENVGRDLEAPGWKLAKHDGTRLLKCKERSKLCTRFHPRRKFCCQIDSTHPSTNHHLDVASTMSSIREDWWIPGLRSRVKKVINRCNLRKVFQTQPYGRTKTADLPTFRKEGERPFETTGVDFSGPFIYNCQNKRNVINVILLSSHVRHRGPSSRSQKIPDSRRFPA